MFNSGRNEEEETRKFWESVEKEVGEPVLEHALGQYLSGYGEQEGPLWGLLYLTSSTLYFRHFPSANWFSSILSSAGGGSRGEGFSFELPLSRISEVTREGPRSFWQRIVRPFPPVTIVRYDLGADPRALRVSVEHRGEAFVGRLSALVAEV